MSLKNDLKDLSTRLGADLFAVTSVDRLEGAPKGHHPRDVLPNAKSVIVLAIKMLDAQTDILPVGEESVAVSPRQDMFRGHSNFISQELDRIGYSMARFIEKKGFKAYHQMASTGGVDQRYLIGLLSLKHMAVQAGLGKFGRNALLITPEFGPRVRLTAIVTDAEIEPDNLLSEDFCSSCNNLCILSCPSKALEEKDQNSPYKINKFACSQYLNTKPTCGVCLKVCPIGNQRAR